MKDKNYKYWKDIIEHDSDRLHDCVTGAEFEDDDMYTSVECPITGRIYYMSEDEDITDEFKTAWTDYHLKFEEGKGFKKKIPFAEQEGLIKP